MKSYTQRLERVHASRFAEVSDCTHILSLFDVEVYTLSGFDYPKGSFTLYVKPTGAPGVNIRRGSYVIAEYSPNEARYRATEVMEASRFHTLYEEAK